MFGSADPHRRDLSSQVKDPVSICPDRDQQESVKESFVCEFFLGIKCHHDKRRPGQIIEVYDTCKTILPGLCGAPASIRCASRASARGRTDPTRAEIVPFSNSVFRLFRREVVASA